MHGFAYYLSGAAGPSPETMTAAGLGHVEPGAFGRIEAGPGGAAGLLLAAAGDEPAVYEPARQTWRPTGSEKRAYLGWWTDEAPGPAELARPRQVMGQAIPLGDGNAWMCPTARYCPARRTLGEDGSPTRTILPAYRGLWDMALEVWRHYEAMARLRAESQATEPLEPPPAPPEGMMTPARELEILVACLGCNYRVGAAEVLALGLLDDTCEEAILRTLIDWDGMLLLLQQQTADSPPFAQPRDPGPGENSAAETSS